VARRWRAARPGGRWGHQALGELLWWTAVALSLRSVFEPVMVAYYLWPPLAVALVAAARDWSRLVPTGCVAVVLTFVSQAQWHNPWIWWTPMVMGLALALYFARIRTREPDAGPSPQMLPESGEQFAADGAP
jgi:energy-coupling factor transporter transmembrane protein EcfT